MMGIGLKPSARNVESIFARRDLEDEKMRGWYKYELFVNGVRRRTETTKFKPNLIAMMIEDLPIVGKNTDEFIMKVERTNKVK